jgi:hypothetical protein
MRSSSATSSAPAGKPFAPYAAENPLLTYRFLPGFITAAAHSSSNPLLWFNPDSLHGHLVWPV